MGLPSPMRAGFRTDSTLPPSRRLIQSLIQYIRALRSPPPNAAGLEIVENCCGGIDSVTGFARDWLNGGNVKKPNVSTLYQIFKRTAKPRQKIHGSCNSIRGSD